MTQPLWKVVDSTASGNVNLLPFGTVAAGYVCVACVLPGPCNLSANCDLGVVAAQCRICSNLSLAALYATSAIKQALGPICSWLASINKLPGRLVVAQ